MLYAQSISIEIGICRRGSCSQSHGPVSIWEQLWPPDCTRLTFTLGEW